jgi:glucokinase
MDVIGLDIGGTKCAAVKSNEAGELLEVRRAATAGPHETLSKLFGFIDAWRPSRNALFGVSCGSPLDHRRGVILSPPNLPGWDEVEICRMLTDRYGGRAWLMNDANACALAEWQFGAGRGKRNMIFLTAGTGMGAGLILDGRLYEGTGGHAGEVGHVRLADEGPVGYHKAGSFEGFCSGGGIAQLAQAKAREKDGRVAFNPGRVEDITARDVALAAQAGDADAMAVMVHSGRRLGAALAILVDVLNPQAIVLGSIYARCRDVLEGPMMEVLAAEALPQSLADCRILPAELGEEIGNVAAVTIALVNAGLRG